MEKFYVSPVGRVKNREDRVVIELESAYIPALKALEGFSHLNILWWFSKCDSEDLRSILTTPKPYRHAPESMGIFATRSPVRPNPIALSVIEPISIDFEKGWIEIGYIDADDGTPVLDIKPYTPSLDRAEHPAVPQWCAHWPGSIEESGDFDWESEMIY